MINSWTIYLITRLDCFQGVFTFISLLLSIGFIVLFIAMIMYKNAYDGIPLDDYYKKQKDS